MSAQQIIWNKVERDQVMNLCELAVASGYSRASLGKMKLPLIGGKISLSDFKRILHQRQERCEELRVAPIKQDACKGASKQSEGLLNGQTSLVADRLFYQR